jgi:hypothetical protein
VFAHFGNKLTESVAILEPTLYGHFGKDEFGTFQGFRPAPDDGQLVPLSIDF